jgi:hypothetical protein
MENRKPADSENLADRVRRSSRATAIADIPGRPQQAASCGDNQVIQSIVSLVIRLD